MVPVIYFGQKYRTGSSKAGDLRVYFPWYTTCVQNASKISIRKNDCLRVLCTGALHVLITVCENLLSWRGWQVDQSSLSRIGLIGMNEKYLAGVIVLTVLCLLVAPAAACHAYLNKIGPSDACDNSDITYKINVTHNTLNGYWVKVVDTLPAGVTYVSSSDGGVYSSGKVTWIYEAKNTKYKDLTVTVKTGLPTSSLKNYAESWVKTPTGSYSNKVTSKTVTTIVKDCEVQMTKEGPGSACTDCDISYTIGASYTGINNNYVKIVDILPEGFTDVLPSDGGIFDAASNSITWTFGPVNDGWTKQVTFTAKPTIAATITNTVASWYGNTATSYTASQISNIITTEVEDCTFVPEFPTLAVPAGFIVGLTGLVLYFRDRKEK